jgi:putative hemolysin
MLRVQVPNGLLPDLNFRHVLHKLALLDHLERLSTRAGEGAGGGSFFANVLEQLNVAIDCGKEDLARIPARGPAILIANHPFGLVEGLVAGSMLAGIRRDFKFLGNAMLCQFPELREHVIGVDVFGGSLATKKNWKVLRESIQWVRGGGMLVIFPAGEVASVHLTKLQVEDPAWNPNVARLVRLTGAKVSPVYFHGANGAGFQFAGLLHPKFRTALLPRELLNKKGTTIRVCIGGPISASSVSQVGTDEAGIDYLRHRTELLRQRSVAKPVFNETQLPQIVPPMDPNILRSEIDELPAEQSLLAHENLVVHIATASQIPNVLREIGRLREISFRQAGEGTGLSIDLDEFDSRYHHLFIWNRDRNEIGGAYRVAGTDNFESRDGQRGLYTSTLFRFKPDFFNRIHPALELGRSFVRPEYQKSYLPLLLLWKGIGHFVAQRPWYRVLFGPVSISASYTTISRSLIVDFLEANYASNALAGSVKPRHRFRSSPPPWSQTRTLASLLPDINELSEVVMDLEPDRKGVPVLVRQYLALGGRMLAFNVDHAFSGALDGLVVVDLTKMSPKLLERYMGKSGAAVYLHKHHAGAA